jgi:hypothetical protein
MRVGDYIFLGILKQLRHVGPVSRFCLSCVRICRWAVMYIYIYMYKQKKVKGSRYRPGVAQRVPGGLGS